MSNPTKLVCNGWNVVHSVRSSLPSSPSHGAPSSHKEALVIKLCHFLHDVFYLEMTLPQFRLIYSNSKFLVSFI